MSLNQLVQDNHKIWLNVAANSIEIDGEINYKNSTKTAGDSLILDANLVAQWEVSPLNIPYGNGISVRPAQQNITNLQNILTLNYLAPFSSLFNFTNGSNKITLVEPGTYIAFVNLVYHNNVSNSLSVTIQYEDSPNQFVDISTIKSFPGRTVYSTKNNVNQSINVMNTAVIPSFVANRRVQVVCVTGSSGVTLDSQYCSFTLLRVASL